ESDRVLVFDPMSLTQVAALIDQSTLVFTPDTSVVHIASATNTPVFLIYSLLSSHFTEWLPYKSKFASVRTEVKGPIESIETDEIVNGFLDFIREEL
ncbi:MAG: glycosyltransferase family 9 protein, partial [Candidatus Kapaibacterium sp.]